MPAINTYVPLGTITLAASASEVIFSGIPASLNGQSFRDLVLVANGTTSDSNGYVILQFNGDTASNYSNVFMTGFGSTVESIASTDSGIKRALMGNVQSAIIWQALDFSATDKHKTVLSRSGANGSTNVAAGAGRWASTSAITSIRIYSEFSSFVSGTTMSIYGIAG